MSDGDALSGHVLRDVGGYCVAVDVSSSSEFMRERDWQSRRVNFVALTKQCSGVGREREKVNGDLRARKTGRISPPRKNPACDQNA